MAYREKDTKKWTAQWFEIYDATAYRSILRKSDDE